MSVHLSIPLRNQIKFKLSPTVGKAGLLRQECRGLSKLLMVTNSLSDVGKRTQVK